MVCHLDFLNSYLGPAPCPFTSWAPHGALVGRLQGRRGQPISLHPELPVEHLFLPIRDLKTVSLLLPELALFPKGDFSVFNLIFVYLFHAAGFLLHIYSDLCSYFKGKVEFSR